MVAYGQKLSISLYMYPHGTRIECTCMIYLP